MAPFFVRIGGYFLNASLGYMQEGWEKKKKKKQMDDGCMASKGLYDVIHPRGPSR